MKHFIIGGAQRSATTYLTQILEAHPEISLAKPVRPEPKFFLKPDEFAEGYKGYRKRYFNLEASPRSKILGEKSTSYIEHAVAGQRIKTLLPDVKLIFLLRHPVERAISNIQFSRMHGFESASLEHALFRELDHPDEVLSADGSGVSVSPQAYLQRSCYFNHLKHWFELFDKDQIKVCITETLTGNLEEIQSVYEFIGADEVFTPMAMEEEVNSSIKKDSEILSSSAYDRLLSYFKPHNEKLADLIGIELGHWDNK